MVVTSAPSARVIAGCARISRWRSSSKITELGIGQRGDGPKSQQVGVAGAGADEDHPPPGDGCGAEPWGSGSEGFGPKMCSLTSRVLLCAAAGSFGSGGGGLGSAVSDPTRLVCPEVPGSDERPLASNRSTGSVLGGSDKLLSNVLPITAVRVKSSVVPRTDLTTARVPTGAVQPASRAARNPRSARDSARGIGSSSAATAVRRSMLRDLEISRASAPWPGAGSITAWSRISAGRALTTVPSDLGLGSAR